jgi:hypothetical protein
MAHLLSKAHHVRTARHEFLASAGVYHDRYLRELGDVPWRESMEQMHVRHTLACLMARVVGRSLLDFLSQKQRERQQSAVVALMKDPPATMTGLIDSFNEHLSRLER